MPKGLELFDLDEVLDLEDHAADAFVVSMLSGATNLAKTECLQGAALVVLATDGALDLSNAESLFSHD